VQLLFGAFTAGLDAGYVSSTWPLMNDHFFPEGVTWLGSALATIGNDPFMIHFIHRWWAWVVVIALVMLARKAKQAGERRAAVAIHASVGLQVLLGIATVVTGMNFWLAVLHQAVGALVVASTTWGLHVVGRRAR
jgi:cytochrome c oxidase assembly protein subunit 15